MDADVLNLCAAMEMTKIVIVQLYLSLDLLFLWCYMNSFFRMLKKTLLSLITQGGSILHPIDYTINGRVLKLELQN